MMNKKKIIISIVILAVLLLVFFLQKNIFNNNINENKVQINFNQEKKEDVSDPAQKGKPLENGNNDSSENINLNKVTKQHVPFIVQAPLGNWDNPIFQDGCEEASIIMAMGWINGIQKFSADEGIKRIEDIVKFEDNTFGFNADTDLSDVEKIFRQHFSYQKIDVRKDIKVQDLINELENGNIILIPAFGQALGNPNFTRPGPIAHMLVVVGYDNMAKEFITNDPGTKRGEGFRYKENVLYDAIWQYPSGKGPLEAPKKEEIEKGMLVVSKP